MTERSVSHSTVVPAPPEAVFGLLADPHRHAVIDPTGTVREVASAPDRLGPDSRFRMRMRIGLPYLVTNRVSEFEPDRRIAWHHFGGHVWRWELEATEGGTQTTETFDWSTSRWPWALESLNIPERNERALKATLGKLAAYFAEQG